MQRARDANPKASIACIGHSLGGHSCGFAGKILYQGVTTAAAAAKRKLDKIIACDPAGPAFDPLMDRNDLQSNWRLKNTDAVFVHAIHTDVALFGTLTPVGHLDVCACRAPVDLRCLALPTRRSASSLQTPTSARTSRGVPRRVRSNGRRVAMARRTSISSTRWGPTPRSSSRRPSSCALASSTRPRAG